MQSTRVATSIGATVAIQGLFAKAAPASASTATETSAVEANVTAQSDYDDLTDGMIHTGTYKTYAGCSARLWVFGLDLKRPYIGRCVENSKGQWELWTMNR